MKQILPTLFVLFLVSACGGKVNTAVPITELPVVASEVVPKVTPVCISSEPVQDDIDRALTYAGDLFGEPEWVRSYTVGNGRVSVAWSSNSELSAVAYVEALVFPCSYEEPDLDDFFNDDNWKVIFGNYASYEAVSGCKTNEGVRLYQFKAIADNAEYAVKYWAQNDTDTRVITVMIVFPVESQSLIDEYSESLFPELTSCP